MSIRKYLDSDGIVKLKALISSAFLGKNQGSENAGKVLGIGTNGIVTPVVGGGGSMDISIIAPEWDETASYVVGDYCTYDGKMWKALGSSVGESPAENEYWHSVSVESQLTHSYTELWSGTWGSGTITVPNTAKYNIFLIRPLSLGTLIMAYKSGAFVRGMGGYSSATPSISTYQFAAEFDGDEWTFVACNGIKHNKSGNHSEVTNYQVAQILGFVYGG